MKKSFFLMIVLFINLSVLFAQAPQSIKFQAVARDSSGNYLPNTTVSFLLSIVKDNMNGDIVYSETHNAVTNPIGIVNLEIGNGFVVSGNFSTIDWGNGSYYLKTSLDITGESNYTFVGTTQLLSVPYSLYANKAREVSLLMLTQAEIDSTNPAQGLMVYNTTTHLAQLGLGDAWFIFTGNCYPNPTLADAGQNLTTTVDSAVLAANVPLVGTGVWTIISGTGGTIDEPGNPTSVFHGVSNTTYKLLWTISNSCGVSADSVIIIMNPSVGGPCPNFPTVTYEGRTYNTVLIGNQCWFKENLNVGTMINGSLSQSNNSIVEKYCYSNDTNNCNIYGGLYQWDEMMQYENTPGTQGICPVGWHIPTDAEFCTMTLSIDPTVDCALDNASTGTTGGAKIKEDGTNHWLSPNTGTNESGFTALGAVFRDVNGSFYPSLKHSAYFWTSNEHPNISYAWRRSFSHPSNAVGRYIYEKTAGYSIRCLKD